jgi:hypothetical protein
MTYLNTAFAIITLDAQKFLINFDTQTYSALRWMTANEDGERLAIVANVEHALTSRDPNLYPGDIASQSMLPLGWDDFSDVRYDTLGELLNLFNAIPSASHYISLTKVSTETQALNLLLG